MAVHLGLVSDHPNCLNNHQDIWSFKILRPCREALLVWGRLHPSSCLSLTLGIVLPGSTMVYRDVWWFKRFRWDDPGNPMPNEKPINIIGHDFMLPIIDRAAGLSERMLID